MEELILVDEDDFEVGHCEKVKCHLGGGMLHRAFSIWILDSRGRVLIQRRAEEKMLWGGFWSNSCCSHPRKDEEIEDAASRRTVEELGVACSFRYIYKFNYAAAFGDIGSEREVCSVYVGVNDEEPVVDPAEISEYRWIFPEDLKKDVLNFPGKYTPWFHLELEELIKRKEI